MKYNIRQIDANDGTVFVDLDNGVSVGITLHPDTHQVGVYVNTEDGPNEADGTPIIAVYLNDATLYDHERGNPHDG